MRTITLHSLLLLSIVSASLTQAETIVVGGKPYDLLPAKLNVCGELNGPEYFAALFMLSAGQSMGEEVTEAACKAGKTEACLPEAIKKSGVRSLFQAIRAYPSRFHSSACAALRDECDKRCKASLVFEEHQCNIECNQYESYNR